MELPSGSRGVALQSRRSCVVSSVFVISSVPLCAGGPAVLGCLQTLSPHGLRVRIPGSPSGLRGLSSFISEELRFLYCEFHICLCGFHSQENAKKSLIKIKSPKCFNLVASPSCKSR